MEYNLSNIPEGQVLLILKSLRPKQWIKNLVVFAGLIFSRNVFNGPMQLKVLLTFITFCGIVSAGYLINDIIDRESDKLHPKKKYRPIASGSLKPQFAVLWAVLLIILSLALSLVVDYSLPLFLLAYLALQLAYSGFLKHLVIIDVLAIASGFVIRAAAGATVIQVAISPWLIVCTLLLALFLSLAKRRAELVSLDDMASAHRRNLEHYSMDLVDQMIGVTASATIVSYSLYSFTAYGTSQMMLTIPFVLYGIFRYLYLIHGKSRGGSPEQVLLTDRPLLINTFLWAMVAIVILQFI